MRNNLKQSAGFTLLELLVSIAAIALMSIILSQVFFSTLRTNTKTELLKDVKQNGDIAQEIMVRAIQNAKSVSSSCSNDGVASQSIDIVNADGDAKTLGCALDGAVTRIAMTGSSTEYLTSSNVTLGGASCAGSSLAFVCKGGAGSQSTITMTFSLAQKGTPVDQFEKASGSFQTSATTRNLTP